VAQDGLARLDDWLLGASQDAYQEGMTVLTGCSPLGTAAGLRRLAEVRFRSLTGQHAQAGVALRWEVAGDCGRLFPVLDADLVLTSAADDKTGLTLAGTYRLPLGILGAGTDQLIVRRVAEATIRNFLERVAAAIAGPPVTPGSARPAG
jgi:hypothetical protein